jgi:hypothetical protein
MRAGFRLNVEADQEISQMEVDNAQETNALSRLLAAMLLCTE